MSTAQEVTPSKKRDPIYPMRMSPEEKGALFTLAKRYMISPPELIKSLVAQLLPQSEKAKKKLEIKFGEAPKVFLLPLDAPAPWTEEQGERWKAAAAAEGLIVCPWVCLKCGDARDTIPEELKAKELTLTQPPRPFDTPSEEALKRPFAGMVYPGAPGEPPIAEELPAAPSKKGFTPPTRPAQPSPAHFVSEEKEPLCSLCFGELPEGDPLNEKGEAGGWVCGGCKRKQLNAVVDAVIPAGPVVETVRHFEKVTYQQATPAPAPVSKEAGSCYQEDPRPVEPLPLELIAPEVDRGEGWLEEQNAQLEADCIRRTKKRLSDAIAGGEYNAKEPERIELKTKTPRYKWIKLLIIAKAGAGELYARYDVKNRNRRFLIKESEPRWVALPPEAVELIENNPQLLSVRKIEAL